MTKKQKYITEDNRGVAIYAPVIPHHQRWGQYRRAVQAMCGIRSASSFFHKTFGSFF